jgi:hypothetical protein
MADEPGNCAGGYLAETRGCPQLSGTPPPSPDTVVPESGVPAGGGAIEIEVAAGAPRMRITGAVDAATLRAVVAALTDGRNVQVRPEAIGGIPHEILYDRIKTAVTTG